MELNNKVSLETPASVNGILAMVIFALVVLQNRGDQNIFIWLVLRGAGMAVMFGVGYGLYMLLYSFCREVLFDNRKSVIITAIVIGVIILAMAGTNSWSANPIL